MEKIGWRDESKACITLGRTSSSIGQCRTLGRGPAGGMLSPKPSIWTKTSFISSGSNGLEIVGAPRYSIGISDLELAPYPVRKTKGMCRAVRIAHRGKH